MQILILSTFDTYGGAAIASMRLHKAFNKKGEKSTMLVQEKKGAEQNVASIADTWLNKKRAFVRFALDRLQFSFYEKSKDVRFIFSQATIGTDISSNSYIKEADVIHVHWINFGFLSVHSLQKIIATGKPIVVTMHDMWFFTGGCHYSKDCLNYKIACGNCLPYLKHPSANDLSHTGWLKKQAMLRDAAVTFVACSEWLAGIARSSSLLADKRVLSIPNPIDTGIFKPVDKALARTYHKVDPDKKYILFAAMKVTDERKGFQFFKEALVQLKKSRPDIGDVLELIVFGLDDATDFDSIPFKIRSLGRLSDIERITNAYAAASVFVIPSLEDNLPNTVMESMSCGTPVVGFNTGGIPEMVDHKQTGYIAEYKSAEDLANGIYWTLFESDYARLCKQSREKVLNTYSEEIVTDKYMQVYQTALKDRN